MSRSAQTHFSDARRPVLLGTVALAALLLAVQPARAQEAPANAANAQDEDVPIEIPKISVTDSARQPLSATTEGTKSYATPAVTVAGKAPVALKDIPNSVSVITRQQMDDQGMVDLYQALNQATGITATPNDGIQSQYAARGFALGAMNDGIPSYNGLSGYQQFDLAIYDRVEVLRGSSGLLQGSSEPGGSVNLVSKRARDKLGVSGAVSYGSWNNKRVEADVTGPLNADGSLRGRAVVVGVDRDFFYDNADSQKVLGYGILEYDPEPNTTISYTAIYQDETTSPFMGQPLYTDITLLDAPRSFNPMAPWSDYSWKIHEEKLGVEHRFDNQWIVKAVGSWRASQFHFKDGYLTDGINPTNNTGPYARRDNLTTYYRRAADVFATGPFKLFGQEHNALAGINADSFNSDSNSGTASALTNVPIFNPGSNLLNEPEIARLTGSESRTIQYGQYGQLRLRVLDPLLVVVGGRNTYFKNQTRNIPPSAPTAWKSGAKASGEFTPYAGVVIDVTKQTSLYGSYSEIFVPQTATTYTGEVLPPREGQQYEVGVKNSFFDGKLNATAALFKLNDVNRSVTDTAHPTFSLAGGEAESKGLETEVSGRPFENFDVTAGYTYMTTQMVAHPTSQGTPINNWWPRHTFKAWGVYHITDGELEGLSFGGGVNAKSKITGNGSTYLLGQNAYAVFNGMVGYKINENISASLNANNIFDNKYLARIGGTNTYNVYGEPRSFMLTLRASM